MQQYSLVPQYETEWEKQAILNVITIWERLLHRHVFWQKHAWVKQTSRE